LVDDTIVLMQKFWLICMTENPQFKSLPSFLFGESMGGAVALKIHLKEPQEWNGAILCAPMCKVLFFKTQSC
jgi:acylglycerol lipase